MSGSRRWTVERPDQLLAQLLAKLGLKRTAVKNLLRFGAVSVNGNPTRQFDLALASGDQIVVGDLKSAAASNQLQAARIRIVHEDEALLVVDKPSGLLTVATDDNKTDTLFARLRAFLIERDGSRAAHPHVVHRLDRETSGLVLFAKSAEVKQVLQASWPEVKKTYWAVVEGRPMPAKGNVHSFLVESKSLRVYSSPHPTEGGREAMTHYRTRQIGDGCTLVEIDLETGRKHQIRVHLADLGCPVTGDVRYGAKLDLCGRLALHAGSLAFPHPVGGAEIRLESPLPPPLRRLFKT
ncbi:MAG: RluA family pseudouridine synthase [Pirellula sp.]|nr:RluA family pseudouridine synthase [Pirellula sp.]